MYVCLFKLVFPFALSKFPAAELLGCVVALSDILRNLHTASLRPHFFNLNIPTGDKCILLLSHYQFGMFELRCHQLPQKRLLAALARGGQAGEPPPVLGSEISSGHSHTHSFMYRLWVPSRCSGRAKQRHQEPTCLLSGLLWKRFADPVLERPLQQAQSLTEPCCVCA